MAEVTQELKNRAISEWNRRCVALIDEAAENGLRLLDQGDDTKSLVGIELAIDVLMLRDALILFRDLLGKDSDLYIKRRRGWETDFHRDKIDEAFKAMDAALDKAEGKGE